MVSIARVLGGLWSRIEARKLDFSMKKNAAEKRIAVVTGATKGLGRAIAERFAEAGFEVFVCARNEADLAKMAAENALFRPFSADFSKKEDVEAFADFVKKEAPRVDVLVNNAGIYLPGSVLGEADGTLERLLEVNLLSAYRLTRALQNLILDGAETRPVAPHIFNICSIASQIAYPNGGAYSISKFALLGFSKNLREELKTRGAKVTAVLPGATWSDSWRGVELPESRLMQARDIADLVWASFALSRSAVVEDIVVRPQLGDL